MIDLFYREIGLLHSPGVSLILRVSGYHHQSPRGDQGHQGILVHRQFLLSAGKQVQPGAKPVREVVGDLFYRLGVEPVIGIPESALAARAAQAVAGVAAAAGGGHDVRDSVGQPRKVGAAHAEQNAGDRQPRHRQHE